MWNKIQICCPFYVEKVGREGFLLTEFRVKPVNVEKAPKFLSFFEIKRAKGREDVEKWNEIFLFCLRKKRRREALK